MMRYFSSSGIKRLLTYKRNIAFLIAVLDLSF